MTTGLLPCPFCGHAAYDDEETFAAFGKRNGHHKWAIACSWCEASAPGAETLAEAKAQWNRRAQNEAMCTALLPFSELAADYDEDGTALADDTPVTASLGECRQARTAYQNAMLLQSDDLPVPNKIPKDRPSR